MALRGFLLCLIQAFIQYCCCSHFKVNAYNFSQQRDGVLAPNGEVPHFPAWAGPPFLD
jgi:hypothetical protein